MDNLKKILVPDVGEATDVEVIEILVEIGDKISKDESLVVLESDKASMEIPSPSDGEVRNIQVKEGDKVEEGDLILELSVQEARDSADSQAESSVAAENESDESTGHQLETAKVLSLTDSVRIDKQVVEKQDAANMGIDGQEHKTAVLSLQGSQVHAGPAVRKQAREYGVDLTALVGSGGKGRILKEDVKAFVKQQMDRTRLGNDRAVMGIPKVAEVDFSKFGAVEIRALSRIRKVSAKNLHRSWLNVPHVTQFDEADITELEDYRKQQNIERAEKGVKLTPLAFIVKSVVCTLKEYPQFNASLHPDGERVILKKYINIGIAVETEEGLIVPVIRGADCKGIEQLAKECAELARQAREKKLPLDAMQGSCFTISSLGGIGGTAFTAIVNAPEVAILGVSRATVKPIFDGENFQPRTILPLSLSYDHRAIDGAEAARFASHLAKMLSDVRHMLL